MTINRPSYYPYHALDQTVELPTVAEGSGYIPATIANPDVANALGQSAGFWHQHTDLGRISPIDLINRTTKVRSADGDSLEYPLGSGLANLVPDNYPTIFYGGERIAFDMTALSLGGANPITFAASSRTWIYGSAPAAPGEYPSIRIENVALATPSAPGSDEFVLGGVDTDLTQVITLLPCPHQTTLPISTALSLFAGSVTSLTVGSVSADPSLVVSNGGAGVGMSVTDGALFDAIQVEILRVVGDGVEVGFRASDQPGLYSAEILGNGEHVLTSAALHVDGDAGYAMHVEASGTDPAIYVDHTGTDAGVYAVRASNLATDIATIIGIGNTGTGPGAGVAGYSAHADSPGVLGVTGNTVTLDNAGVIGQGGAVQGSGVRGYAPATGHGVIAHSATNARSAFRMVPQSADASSGRAGDLLVNNARGAVDAVARLNNGSVWQSLHQSAKGFVSVWGDGEAGGPIAGGSGELSNCEIYPEQVGDVLVTATGNLLFSTNDGNGTIAIWDTTDNVLIATQNMHSPNDAGAGVPRNASFAIRFPYTLPDTDIREFAVILTALTGTLTYSNVVCSVTGIQ